MPRAVDGMKQCSKCGEVKPVSEFSKDRSKTDGLRNYCKACIKQHYKYNKEHKKQYYEDNKERENVRSKQYYEDNKERIKEYSKQYYKENREDRLEYSKQWNKENKEHKKQYNKEHREQINQCYRQWEKQKRINDPTYRLNENISGTIRLSLKGNKQGHHWEDLVGYTCEQLMSHLESQFENWMNWNNHGTGEDKWHIDHIVPVSLFKFENFEDPEFKMCWCLSNLRPLSSLINLSEKNSFGTDEKDILEAKLILAEEASVLEEYQKKIKGDNHET